MRNRRHADSSIKFDKMNKLGTGDDRAPVIEMSVSHLSRVFPKKYADRTLLML